LVILTSNAERELPAPFIRRCLRLDIKEPEPSKLERIVESHFGKNEKEKNEELIKNFIELRQKGSLATDQLLNAIYLTTNKIDLSVDTKDMDSLCKSIFKYLSTVGTV
jgi:MoxR-like ATPase